MEPRMLSTIDNPFNPFIDFDAWNHWDRVAGYHTLAYLARIIFTSPDLSDVEQDEAIEAAIDEIIEENITGMYITVQPGTIPRPLQRLSDSA